MSFSSISGKTNYDAATANWGSTWRMPTKTEYQELIDDCTWTWNTQTNSDGDAINGYNVKGSNGNSIFLPAAGNYYWSTLSGEGTYGHYWTSTANSSDGDKSYRLFFYSTRPNADSAFAVRRKFSASGH